MIDDVTSGVHVHRQQLYKMIDRQVDRITQALVTGPDPTYEEFLGYRFAIQELTSLKKDVQELFDNREDL